MCLPWLFRVTFETYFAWRSSPLSEKHFVVFQFLFFQLLKQINFFSFRIIGTPPGVVELDDFAAFGQGFGGFVEQTTKPGGERWAVGRRYVIT